MLFILLIWIALIINSFLLAFNVLNFNQAVMMVIVTLIVYVANQIYEFIKKSHRLINSESFFFYFLSIFHFSYVILFFLGISDYDYEVFYNDESLVKAIYFSNICLLIFILGYRLYKPNRTKTNTSYQPISSESQVVLSYLRLISLATIVFALLFFWIPIISLAVMGSFDYKSLISVGAISPIGRLFWVSQYMGYFGISLYLSTSVFLLGNLKKDKLRYIAYMYVLSYLLIGDRGGFISFFVLLLFAWTYNSRKTLKVSSIVILSFVILVSPIIAEVRTDLPTDFSTLSNVISSQNNLILSMLTEFGSTIKTVSIAIYYVPQMKEFWYGESYLSSALIVLPNLLGEARSSSDLATFVTEVAFGPLDSTHGRGGSIVMESYLNFGYYGSILFVLLGFYLKEVQVRYSYSSSLMNSVLLYGSIAAVSMWIRNTSSVSFRIIVWTIALSFLAILVARFFAKR